MKLFEYQAKQFLATWDLPIPEGTYLASLFDIDLALEQFGHSSGVLKSQVLVGGRGKAGGILFFDSHKQAREQATALFGKTLITKQTGPTGVKVKSLWIEALTEVKRELYLAILTDRSQGCNAIIISPQGGMNIEEIAEDSPELLLKIYPTFGQDLTKDQLSQAQELLEMDDALFEDFYQLVSTTYKAYLHYDATLLEINPLAITKDDKLSILDCKMTIDENALFRQEDIGVLANPEHSAAEIEAARFGLNYIAMDGDIGCMVNGAGLAMATMDSIKFYGGSPANFLDVGGSANEEAIQKALEIITSDKHVKTILVNIFGGIMHCDIIARGIVAALEKSHLKLPLVVRLQGTNAIEANAIIDASDLNIHSVETMDDAAQRAVFLS